MENIMNTLATIMNQTDKPFFTSATVNIKTPDIVAQICAYLEKSIQEPDLQELAAHFNLSMGYIQKLMKKHTGLSPKQYFKAKKLHLMQQQLQLSEQSIIQSIFQSGYNNTSEFYDGQHQLGMKASNYKRKGKGEDIYFACGTCSLGVVLVAQTVKGICAIFLGESAEELLHQLEEQFSQANLIGGNPFYENAMAEVVGMIDLQQNLQLPLDIRGSIFQKQVWTILQHIPAGQTLSYQEVAQKLGNPKATRAVANACASNTLAIAIPCHRVVRTDHSLSGYRWGIERKRRLLEAEAQ
jgi:AraC family transcriptional regulator, regulatory protein of adaptative response / methylated-DNA-[protein]-cysteine methyltransferase